MSKSLLLSFLDPNVLADASYKQLSAWPEHIPFAFWCISELRPRVFVELGTHKGVSYCAFCQAVAAVGAQTRCFAVDTWQGDAQAGLYGNDVFDELQKYHDAHYSAFSRLMRGTFDEARSQFEDGSIDLLHIDGFHTYEAVKHDFETWLPKMSRRGVVLFHDTTVRREDFGIWKFWEEFSSEYPHFEFHHGHGLGVLAVGADAPAPVRELCALPEVEKNKARALFGRLGRGIATAFELEALIAERKAAESKRFLTRQKNRWAPPGSIQRRWLSLAMRAARAATAQLRGRAK